MWGKGRKLEIHVNNLSRSMLVRLPNDYIRQKVLEKRMWYVGTSMFHVAQWNGVDASSPSHTTRMQLWAHLKGVPFDLIHEKGLCLLAGLVGEPKETNDYTKNLTSTNVAHVKVEVDITKPLPTSVEFVRENGSVTSLEVEYPWTPPSCSNCKAIGHIIRNCPAPVIKAKALSVEKQKQSAHSKQTGKFAYKEKPMSLNSGAPMEAPRAEESPIVIAPSASSLPQTKNSPPRLTSPLLPQVLGSDPMEIGSSSSGFYISPPCVENVTLSLPAIPNHQKAIVTKKAKHKSYIKRFKPNSASSTSRFIQNNTFATLALLPNDPSFNPSVFPPNPHSSTSTVSSSVIEESLPPQGEIPL